MIISLPELHEGRDGRTELYKLVNQLRRAMLALDTDVASIPIVPYFSSDSDGDGTTTDSDSNTAAIAATTMAQARFWLSTANPSFPFAVDMSALGSGVLKQTVSGGISTPGLVTISTGIAYANPTMTAWLSTGIAGGQSAIGGTAASENLTLSSTTNGTKGKILFGSSSYFFNESFGEMLLGGGPYVAGGRNLQISSSVSDAWVAATTTYTGVTRAGFVMALEATYTGGSPSGLFYVTNGSWVIPTQANSVVFDCGGTGMVDIAFCNIADTAGSGISFTTGSSRTERVRINNNGSLRTSNSPYVSFSNTTAVTPANPTVAEWAITPPSTISAASLGALHSWDAVTLTLTGSTHHTGNNLALARFVAPTITDASAVTIDKAATMTVTAGPVASGSVTLTTSMAIWSQAGQNNFDGTVMIGNPLVGSMDVLHILGSNAVAAASSAGLTWDPIVLDANTLTVTGGTTINDVHGVLIKTPTITDGSAITITKAATLSIQGQPNAAGSVTISNSLALDITGGWEHNNTTGANSERIQSFWFGNVWTLKSTAIGTGTVRAMNIDADTATITIQGKAGLSIKSTSLTITSETGGTGHDLTIVGNNSDSAFGASSFLSFNLLTTATANSGFSANFTSIGARVQGSPTGIASAAGATLNAIILAAGATVNGTTTIATAAGFNHVTVPRPSIVKGDAGALTITNSASFYVENSPLAGTNVTITNPYAVWVDNGIVRTDGGVTPGAGAACTLANSGGSGPTTAAQLQWLPWNVDGQPGFIPFWK